MRSNRILGEVLRRFGLVLFLNCNTAMVTLQLMCWKSSMALYVRWKWTVRYVKYY